jgi:hypothetical protein
VSRFYFYFAFEAESHMIWPRILKGHVACCWQIGSEEAKPMRRLL